MQLIIYKYQELLQSIREKNYEDFIQAITSVNNSVSDYMKTSIKTLIEFKDKIYNTFNNDYHNGYIEGNNNFIKVLKRIAFGFRSFRRFKARIMICKGLVKINKKSQRLRVSFIRLIITYLCLNTLFDNQPKISNIIELCNV